MQGNNPNTYKRARQEAGLTQEAAAELLFTSVESLKAYETGLRLPPNDMAGRMAREYGTPWLAVEHLQATSGDLGVMPEIRVQGLPTAVLTLVNRCAGMDSRLRTLMRIAEDGVVDETEQASFDAIAAELSGLIGATYQVLYPTQGAKKDRPEGGASRRSAFVDAQQTKCNQDNRKNSISHWAGGMQVRISQEGDAFL